MNRLFFVLALLCGARGAAAHEFKPARLSVETTADSSASITWERPMVAGAPAHLDLGLPDGCAKQAEVHTRDKKTDRSHFQLACDRPLHGQSLTILGFDSAGSSVWADVDGQGALLTMSTPSLEFGADTHGHSFFSLGVEHVLLGPDHLLFVLGLVFLVGWRMRTLAWTITAFTVAHSVTLAGSVLGHVTLPSTAVEVSIALSIVLLARELLIQRQDTFAARFPWAFAFLCGLFHGFGFAGALSELGVVDAHAWWSLLSFNAGVEAGQLAFVGALLGIAAVARRLSRHLAGPRGRAFVLIAMGGVGGFWMVQRISQLIAG